MWQQQLFRQARKGSSFKLANPRLHPDNERILQVSVLSSSSSTSLSSSSSLSSSRFWPTRFSPNHHNQIIIMIRLSSSSDYHHQQIIIMLRVSLWSEYHHDQIILMIIITIIRRPEVGHQPPQEQDNSKLWVQPVASLSSHSWRWQVRHRRSRLGRRRRMLRAPPKPKDLPRLQLGWWRRLIIMAIDDLMINQFLILIFQGFETHFKFSHHIKGLWKLLDDL